MVSPYMEEEQQKQYNIVDTSATKKIFELTKRIRAVCGGTSASKTVSILIWLIDYCQKRQEREKLATVVSESYPHLEKGAMLDFEIIMKDRGYWDDSKWNKTKHIYTWNNGNKLEFFSVDTYGKAHGPRRDILFLNECNNLHFNIVDQLITRTREVVWLDWNPTNEFWFYLDMLPSRKDDIDFITLTYLDNEGLDVVSKKEIESHRNNKNWWTVYGLGQLGVIESRIYKGWEFIDEVPHEARLDKYGLDFGYSNDPTAIVAVYKYNGGYILDEQTYLKGLSNKLIADVFLALPGALVIADSAEPKSIDEIKSYGVNIVGVSKQRGENKTDTFIKWSIGFVQDQRISVTKKSLNIIKEYRNYVWITDKNEKILNEPGEGWDHTMDALRYAIASGQKLVNWKPNDPGGIKPLFEGLPG